MKEKTLRIRIDGDQYDVINSIAKKETEGNISALIRKVIKAFLDKKSAKKT